MTNKANGPSAFVIPENPGSAVASAFYERERIPFQQILDHAAVYAREGDGNSLLLMDAALLGLAQHVRDYLQRLGLKVESAPPSVGDELSKRFN